MSPTRRREASFPSGLEQQRGLDWPVAKQSLAGRGHRPARPPGDRQNPTSSPTSRVPVGLPDEASGEAEVLLRRSVIEWAGSHAGPGPLMSAYEVDVPGQANSAQTGARAASRRGEGSRRGSGASDEHKANRHDASFHWLTVALSVARRYPPCIAGPTRHDAP